MIDLPAIARAFVDPAIEITKGNIQKKMDALVVDAVHDKWHTDRKNVLRNWLRNYAVFQGFTADDRQKVVDRILDFADTQGCHFDILGYDVLIEKFRCLHGMCGRATPLTNNNKERDLTSLTSKALWCCYPNAVPIFDRNAQNALWILCKLAQLRLEQSDSDRYAAFADAWFKVYEQVESIVAAETERIGYPYKVRVFDRILWVIGQPKYTGDISDIPVARLY